MGERDLTRLAGRPRRFGRRADGLALRRAMPDRLLPALVAAMTFLAALTLAGAVGAALLAQRWSSGAAAVMTVQVPDPEQPSASGGATRQQAVLAALARDPAFVEAEPVDPARLNALLAPWLGVANATGDQSAPPPPVPPPPAPPPPAIALPGVIQARLQPGGAAPADLAARLDALASGTVAERNQPWTERLVLLTRSLQACAGLALLVVFGVAVAVVAAATRAGLAARRHAIEIVHDLGAGDGYIAGRFARRTSVLALSGGIAGTVLSVPLLLLLCRLGAPFAGGASGVAPAAASTASMPAGAGVSAWLGSGGPEGALSQVPLPLWIALPLLPPIAASIGWLTAQATVRAWLRRLP